MLQSAEHIDYIFARSVQRRRPTQQVNLNNDEDLDWFFDEDTKQQWEVHEKISRGKLSAKMKLQTTTLQNQSISIWKEIGRRLQHGMKNEMDLAVQVMELLDSRGDISQVPTDIASLISKGKEIDLSGVKAVVQNGKEFAFVMEYENQNPFSKLQRLAPTTSSPGKDGNRNCSSQ